ncbi:MAG: hypothetical protein JWP36_773 [Paucimonas sp.]|nr:hypothetical protein [Paucimonas sp.]
MVRPFIIFVTTIFLASCGGGDADAPQGASTSSAPPVQQSPSLKPGFSVGRQLADQPDDITGAQVHLMYVLPSDGPDKQLDLGDTIPNSVESANRWLAAQTGGRRLRMDTFGGRVDITFAKLPRTDAQYQAAGSSQRRLIETDLGQMGLLQAGKIYMAYYEGGGKTCANAPLQPENPGFVAVTYLHGTPAGGAPCIQKPFVASSSAAPDYKEFGLLHEVLHTLGAVDKDAPDYFNGHVNNDPSDLMYAGPLTWNPSVLDINRKNYYNPDGLPSNIFNFATSPFLGAAGEEH